jgi:hypothetical protein
VRWTRREFAGIKYDGTQILYNGYTSGSFGVVRLGKRTTYYDVIHLPSGTSMRPRRLWLKKLVEAKAYAEAVAALQLDNAWLAPTCPLKVADAILVIAHAFEEGRSVRVTSPGAA